MKDQAQALRDKMRHSTMTTADSPRKTRVLTITSGKGGVGKSSFSLNFALSLIKHNQSVLLMDLDLGFANMDVLLGRKSSKSLRHLIDEECSIWEIAEEGPQGLRLISGGMHIQQLWEMDGQKTSVLMEKLGDLQGEIDFLILDTGAGLTRESIRFLLAADELVVVTTPEPTSMTDAYAVLKAAHAHHSRAKFQCVINRCTDQEEGDRTAAKLNRVARQFFGQPVFHLGNLPDDPYVSRAVKKQTPFVLQYPKSPAAKAMEKMIFRYLQDAENVMQEKGVGQFIKKLIRVWDFKW